MICASVDFQISMKPSLFFVGYRCSSELWKRSELIDSTIEWWYSQVLYHSKMKTHCRTKVPPGWYPMACERWWCITIVLCSIKVWDCGAGFWEGERSKMGPRTNVWSQNLPQLTWTYIDLINDFVKKNLILLFTNLQEVYSYAVHFDI